MQSGIIEISFGEVSKEPQTLFDATLHINTQKSNEMENHLRELGFDPVYSLFFKIPNNNNCDLDAITTIINDWTSPEIIDELAKQETNKQVRGLLESGTFSLHTKRDNSSLWIQIKFADFLAEGMAMSGEAFIEMSDLGVTFDAQNKVEISIASDHSFHQFLDDIKSKTHSLVSSFLRNLDVKLKISVRNDFISKFKFGMEQIGMGNMPGIDILENIAALEIFEFDLKNKSIDNLPAQLKAHLAGTVDKNMAPIFYSIIGDSVISKLLDSVGGNFEIMFCHKDILAFHLKAKGDGAFRFISEVSK